MIMQHRRPLLEDASHVRTASPYMGLIFGTENKVIFPQMKGVNLSYK